MSVRAGALIASVVATSACGRFDFDPAKPDAALGMSDGHVSAAPAFVQKAEDDGVGLASAAVTFTSDVTAGNLLIAAIDWGNPGPDPTSFTDSAGDTFTQVEKPTQGGWRTIVGYAIASTGGPMTITFTLPTASSTVFNLRAFEYSNVAPTQPVSATAGATGTGVGPDASTTTISTQESNELLFGFFTLQGNGLPGTNFTLRSSFDGDVVEDQVAPTAGSYMVVGSSSPAASAWSLTAVAIRGK